MVAMKPYRPCVLAVFINSQHQVLVALRSDTKTWQFPQGGVDDGEDVETTLYREMKEELGTRSFEVLRRAPEAVRYDFPKSFQEGLSKTYKGQEQTWFLCKFHEGHGPELEKASSDEFLDTRWVSLEEALEGVISWKQDSYKDGLQLLKMLPMENEDV